MKRAILAGFALAFAMGCPMISAAAMQSSTQPPTKPPDTKSTDTKAKGKEVEEPPEEDESLIPKECVLNPLEAARDIRAGDFYFKKSKYGSAAFRYKDATCWDPSSAEAFLKLGEAEEKLHNYDKAHEAYQKYLEIVPDAKNAGDIKKKLARLLAK